MNNGTHHVRRLIQLVHLEFRVFLFPLNLTRIGISFSEIHFSAGEVNSLPLKEISSVFRRGPAQPSSFQVIIIVDGHFEIIAVQRVHGTFWILQSPLVS